ncbi:hypothetical protein ISCGN_020219 [Ixodes scapularis]
MDVTTDEFLKVQKELQAALKKNESLQLENSQIIEEIRVLKDELERKAEELQRLSESSGQETSALNDIITGKNEEIARYREELHHHKERLAELSLNTEQSTVNVLRKALEDRDRQIDHLTKHLEQATKDIEDNSVIIESLRQQQDSSGVAGGGQPRRSSKWFDLQQKLREKSLELKSAQDMLGKVEDEAKQKDKELADAVMVMRRYELGEYGLADAVAEIRDLKKQVGIRDREIEKLTQQLNELEMDVEEVSEENETLREKLSLDPDVRLTPPKKRKPEKAATLQEKIEQLEEANIELQQKLRQAFKEKRKSPSPESIKIKSLVNRSTQVSPTLHDRKQLLQSREESGSVSASSNTSFTMSQLQAEKKMLKAELKAVKRKYSKQLEHSELKVKQLQKKVSERRKRSKATISRSTSPPSEKRPRTVDVGTHTDKFQAHGNAPRQPSPSEVDDISLLSQCTSLSHLYRDLMNERSDWKTRVEKLSAEKIEIIEEVAGRAASNEQRYNELLNQLSSTDPELKEGLLRLDAEAKQIMDREVALRRRCAVLENERALLQSEISRQTSLSFLKDDIILEQLGQVEVREEMASLRIKSLQNCLEQTVPKETFQSLYQQHALLAQKFRNVVEELTESGYSETEKLKTILAKVHAELQTLQKRHEDQGSELLKAKLETHVRVQQLSKVLKQLRFEYCGMVPLDRQAKLLGKIAQLKSENMRLRSAKPSEPRGTTPPGRRETESGLEKELDGANLPERWSSEAFQEAFSFLKTHATQLESENLLLEQELHKMQLLLQENEMELNSIRKELLCLQENLQPETSKDQNNLMESMKAQTEELLSLKQNAKLLQKMLTEERENLKIATTSIQVKDKIIEELKSAAPEIRSDEKANDLSNDKLKRSLHTAMVTVNSLQALHDQKECTLTRYRELVSSLREEMSKDRARFAKEISGLQTELMKEHRQSILSLKEATSGLHAKGDLSEECSKKQLDEIRRLKNAVAERHEAAVEATEKLKLREQELRRLQQEMAKLRLPTPPAITSKSRSFSAKRPALAKKTSADVNLGRRLFASLQEQLEQKAQTIAHKDAEIEQLKERVASLQTVIDQTAKKGLSRQVQRLKSQVDEKEKQLQALSKAMIDLRSEMMSAVGTNAVQPASQSGRLENEENVEVLKDAIADLEVKVAQLKSDLRSALEREQFLNDEARLLKEDNEKLRENCSRASTEKQELIRKLDRLRRPVTPKQIPSIQHMEAETVDRLRKEISMLRGQLRNLDKPEKPYEQLEQMASSRVEVARWEESKKWQSAVEKLKVQYKEASQKLEASEKMTRLLRTQTSRLEQEKDKLTARVQHYEKMSSLEKQRPSSETVALQKKIAELEAHVKAPQADSEDKMAELRTQNNVLRKQIQDLEKGLVRKQMKRKVVHISGKQGATSEEHPTATEHVSKEDAVTLDAEDHNKVCRELEKYKSQVDILRVTVDRLHDELLQTRLLVERRDDPSTSSEVDSRRQDFQDTLIRENVALRLDLRASRSLLQQRESELLEARYISVL